jgi:hypothetical protein
MRKQVLIFTLLISTAQPDPAQAGQPMKCVDGTGRIIYTELTSCAEALRAAPPAPKSRLDILREKERKAQEDLAKARANRQAVRQEFKDKFRQMEIDIEYKKRQRLRLEEEQREKECAAMLVESDRRDALAMKYAYDGWWKSRSREFDKEMEEKCGHQVRLRRN